MPSQGLSTPAALGATPTERCLKYPGDTEKVERVSLADALERAEHHQVVHAVFTVDTASPQRGRVVHEDAAGQTEMGATAVTNNLATEAVDVTPVDSTSMENEPRGEFSATPTFNDQQPSAQAVTHLTSPTPTRQKPLARQPAPRSGRQPMKQPISLSHQSLRHRPNEHRNEGEPDEQLQHLRTLSPDAPVRGYGVNRIEASTQTTEQPATIVPVEQELTSTPWSSVTPIAPQPKDIQRAVRMAERMNAWTRIYNIRQQLCKLMQESARPVCKRAHSSRSSSPRPRLKKMRHGPMYSSVKDDRAPTVSFVPTTTATYPTGRNLVRRRRRRYERRYRTRVGRYAMEFEVEYVGDRPDGKEISHLYPHQPPAGWIDVSTSDLVVNPILAILPLLFQGFLSEPKISLGQGGESKQTDVLTTCTFCWKLTAVTHHEKRSAKNEMNSGDITGHDSETSCPQISLADYVERRMVNLSGRRRDNGEGSSERSGEDDSGTDSGKDSGEDNGDDGEDGSADNDQDDNETESEGDQAQPMLDINKVRSRNILTYKTELNFPSTSQVVFAFTLPGTGYTLARPTLRQDIEYPKIEVNPDAKIAWPGVCQPSFQPTARGSGKQGKEYTPQGNPGQDRHQPTSPDQRNPRSTTQTYIGAASRNIPAAA
ncbi:unnamed protein product [Phytophthora fragariaefolia]|uniref:Unnamed protein product n=1 Tax=Phytophthora fragariaefolia TaxID=1490495 RepID=A0A9W6YPV5_9STRA|nr:unnamed protein product [Phytophthora fragariaefolia]